MTSFTGKLMQLQLHILLNISRSKDNQTMKVGQLTEYNVRNTFLSKIYSKCGAKTSFIVVEDYQNILKLRY